MMSFYYKKRYLRIIDIVPAMKVSKFTVGRYNKQHVCGAFAHPTHYQEAIEFSIVIGCPKKRKNKKNEQHDNLTHEVRKLPNLPHTNFILLCCNRKNIF